MSFSKSIFLKVQVLSLFFIVLFLAAPQVWAAHSLTATILSAELGPEGDEFTFEFDSDGDGEVDGTITEEGFCDDDNGQEFKRRYKKGDKVKLKYCDDGKINRFSDVTASDVIDDAPIHTVDEGLSIGDMLRAAEEGQEVFGTESY